MKTMKSRTFLIPSILMLILSGCFRTDKNKYVIGASSLTLYNLSRIDSTGLYFPTAFDTNTTGDAVTLALLRIDKHFVSDNSDSCDVPFLGYHGQLDTIREVSKFTNMSLVDGFQNVIVDISNLAEINEIISQESIKCVEDDAVAYSRSVAKEFISINAFQQLYNNPDPNLKKFYTVRNIAFPMLVQKSWIDSVRHGNLSPPSIVTSKDSIVIELIFH